MVYRGNFFVFNHLQYNIIVAPQSAVILVKFVDIIRVVAVLLSSSELSILNQIKKFIIFRNVVLRCNARYII
jgi:hypothetical protein